MRIILELQLKEGFKSGDEVGDLLVKFAMVFAGGYAGKDFDDVAARYPKHEPYGTILQETRKRLTGEVMFRVYMSDDNVNPQVVQDQYVTQKTSVGLVDALVKSLIKKASEEK